MTKRLGESVQGGGPTAAPKALRILIGDDDRDSVLSLMMLLRDEGHDVRGVYRGSQVIEAQRAFDPDVVILDLFMPDRSGFEVAREIRPRHGDRPLLIAISGRYTKEPDRILAEITGFNHHLIKPYQPSTLLSLLEPLRSPDAGADS
jgi:DNA-binding response OmpR family regulator